MTDSSGNAFCAVKLVKESIIEGINIYSASPMLEIPSQTEIKLNWLPMTPFLVYMHGTRLTFGKPFVRKQYNYALINRARGPYEEIFVLTTTERVWTERSEVHVP